MATASVSRIKSLAKNAGFTGNDLTMAAAVALAESGGRSVRGTKNSNGSYDYGIWQINDVHFGMRVTLPGTSTHYTVSKANVLDPVINSLAAYRIYSDAGKKFTPWSTYNRYVKAKSSGSDADYLTRFNKYLKIAGEATDNEAASAVADALSGVTGSVSSAVSGSSNSVVSNIEKYASKEFISVGWVVVGIVLIILGIVVLLHNQIPGLVAKFSGIGDIGSALKAVVK